MNVRPHQKSVRLTDGNHSKLEEHLAFLNSEERLDGKSYSYADVVNMALDAFFANGGFDELLASKPRRSPLDIPR